MLEEGGEQGIQLGRRLRVSAESPEDDCAVVGPKADAQAIASRQKGKTRFTLKLDANAGPKAFQLTPVEPANEASGWMLFSREGADLKIAFYDNLQGRPASFEPRGPRSEPELIVVTLAPRK